MQTRSHGQAKVLGNDLLVDLKMSNHSLGNVLEQVEGALDAAPGIGPTRADLMRILENIASDLRLVHRTNEGILKRSKA